MGQDHDVGWCGRPLGMSRTERQLWRLYAERSIPLDAKINYNVRLCQPHACAAELDEDCRLLWDQIGARRIDALVRTAATTEIIEVRPRATEDAIARLLLYKELWIEGAGQTNQIKMILVADQIPADTCRMAAIYGIECVVVRP